MRIISGALKGKSIHFLKSQSTRPLKDSVKENIFNILNHSNKINLRVEHSNILDLYSGIGSFGLECISRGAKKVTFIEKDPTSFNLLKKNLIKLSVLEKSSIINDKIENSFTSISKEKYNIFFLDPPFKNNIFIENLKLIKEKELYSKTHIVIIHREKKTIDEFDNFFRLILVKNYGRSKIIFGTFS